MNPAISTLRRLYRHIHPSRCLLCEGRSEDWFCTGCIHDLPTLDAQHSRLHAVNAPAFAALQYDFPVDQLLQAFKYTGKLSLATPLAALMWSTPEFQALPEHTLLIPVPSSPDRLKLRGFDHMRMLTQELCALSGLSVWNGLVKTSGHAQKGQSRVSRLESVRGRYRLSAQAQRKGLPQRPFALIDDVCTTGASLNACIDVLNRAASPADQAPLELCAFVLASERL